MCFCNWWIKACIFFKSCPTPVQMCSDLPLLVRPGYCLSVSLIDRPDILCPRPPPTVQSSRLIGRPLSFHHPVSCGYRVTPSFVLWSFSSCGLWLLQTELLQLSFPPRFYLSIMFLFLSVTDSFLFPLFSSFLLFFLPFVIISLSFSFSIPSFLLLLSFVIPFLTHFIQFLSTFLFTSFPPSFHFLLFIPSYWPCSLPVFLFFPELTVIILF